MHWCLLGRLRVRLFPPPCPVSQVGICLLIERQLVSPQFTINSQSTRKVFLINHHVHGSCHSTAWRHWRRSQECGCRSYKTLTLDLAWPHLQTHEFCEISRVHPFVSMLIERFNHQVNQRKKLPTESSTRNTARSSTLTRTPRKFMLGSVEILPLATNRYEMNHRLVKTLF